jgi:glycine/D-amino acid oxidase-like deaminating enzyme
MLDGETLYQRYKVIEKWNGTHFVYQILGNQEWHLKPQDGAFTGLYRRPPKRNRPMTTDEMKAWSESDESLGWMVRFVFEGRLKWAFPRELTYYDGPEHYQRARILPDMSGIDKSTIQGFEVEE